jgi:hypothetical protein|tara:strand:- start:4581 stop:5189 length:609 start_codon:yes stop_codon:yes gene_type:complete
MADISTLQQSLINARKVMQKVDNGISVDRTTSSSRTSQSPIPSLPVAPLPNLPNVDTGGARKDLSPKKYMTEQKINGSNLPDAIKQAMIQNPIPDVPFGGQAGLSEEFLEGVRDGMKKQDMPVSYGENIREEVAMVSPTKNKLTNKNLKSLIKESVRELMDEVIAKKIDESIELRTESKENFQFRVGKRVFYGNITSSKTVK